MRLKESFHPYAMVTILFWSLAFVLTRLALQHFTVYSLGFLRYFVASLTLAIIGIFMKMRPPRKKDLLWFFLSGGVGFFLYMIAFNRGLETVTASTSSIIIATVPVMTAFFARFIYKERLRGYQWCAIFVEFVGVVILTVLNGGFSFGGGLFWLCLAAVFLSVYNLFQRKLTKTYSALQVSAYSIFFGTALLAVFSPVSFQEATDAPGIQILYVIILGVCSSAVAYLAWAQAFSKAEKTSQVSNYMFVTPFLTSVLGFFLANEIPEPNTLIGGGIILLGVVLFNFGGCGLKIIQGGSSASDEL